MKMEDFFDIATVTVMCWAGAVLVHGWGVGRPTEWFMNLMAFLMFVIGLGVIVFSIIGAIFNALNQDRKIHKAPKHTVRPNRKAG